MITRHLLLY